jgi:hypothetical protein
MQGQSVRIKPYHDKDCGKSFGIFHEVTGKMMVGQHSSSSEAEKTAMRMKSKILK